MKLQIDLIRIAPKQRLIPIDCSQHVPVEKQEDPRFIELFWAVEAAMNSSKFDREERTQLFVHEGAHLFYARRVGFEPELFGPWIWYDEQANKFGWCMGGVESLPAHLPIPLLDGAKFHVAPQVVVPELLPEYKRSAKQIAAENAGDQRLCRGWYNDRVSQSVEELAKFYADVSDFPSCELDPKLAIEDLARIRADKIAKWLHEKTEPGFNKLMEEALADILHDLEDPRARQEIWACAHEFEQRVFPSEM